jgi:hypothetical protein
MSDELVALTASLGAAPPASVAALDPEVLRRLTEQIEAGRRHHRKVGEDTVQAALKGVPLPVRGIVRKALT